MAGTCGSLAEVARDGDRLAWSNLAALCGATRRGLTNSRAAVRNRKHSVMESRGEHKLPCPAPATEERRQEGEGEGSKLTLLSSNTMIS